MWWKLAAYSCGGSPGIALLSLTLSNAHRIPIFTGHSFWPRRNRHTRIWSDRLTGVKAVSGTL